MKIDPRLVRRRVSLLAPSGPKVTTARARAVAASLRRSARRAPAIVASLTELHRYRPAVEKIPVSVVSRPTWASLASRSVNALFEGAESSAVKNRLLSEEIGIGMSVLAAKILGQFDPWGETDGVRTGRLMLVAPNILAFDSSFDLDSRDVHLFVSVHELTHAFQFTAAPWLAPYLKDCARELIEGEGDVSDQLEKIQTLMSVLEGHAEYVMNNIPLRRLPSLHRIRGAMAAKRADKNQITEVIGKVTGMASKVNQYGTGEKFISAIVAQAGMAGVNRIWESEENLPRPGELKDPQSWITRVLS